MKVVPQYDPVGKFFEYKPMYRVPTYQRSYAWETLEVEDFVRDLETCYNKRKWSDPITHFFGQIVTIKDNVSGAEGQEQYELVDGQQRIATFILLIGSLINIYKSILKTTETDILLNNESGILKKRISDLTVRYISFQQEVGEIISPVHVLQLSKRDLTFFNAFINDLEYPVTLDSHQRIKNAYDLISVKVEELTTSASLKDRLGNLRVIELILENDFFIMNMVVSEITNKNKKEAFTLFQVLNNRGKNLTEGDLLRAETLKILDGYENDQNIVEALWDNILLDDPSNTEKYLKYIYCSYCGKEPGTNTLFIEFLNKFIPENGHENIAPLDAETVRNNIDLLNKDMVMIRKLVKGEWPYADKQPIQRWDRKRLTQLVVSLNHQECLPLLLSLQAVVNHTIFSDIVQIIERFVFRYIIVCKQYIGNVQKVYHEEAAEVRRLHAAYNSITLINKLRTLEATTDDAMFERKLDDLRYAREGAKGPIKYFLITLEYFYRWYQDGAIGIPFCKDKERVYDFPDSTIEHVYPYSAKPGEIDHDIEPLKNSIGNLTILGQDDNKEGGNDSFTVKQANHIFSSSSLKMNTEVIANQANWTKAIVENRSHDLKAMALKIFKI